MTELQRCEEALTAPEAGQALRALIEELASSGQSETALTLLLEQVLLGARQRGAPTRIEDIILDVMDAVAGWCHPAAHIVPIEKTLVR